MTPDQIDQALKAAGLGWRARGGLTTAAAADGDRCNPLGCEGFASVCNAAGMTSDQIMPALILLAGDPLADPRVRPDRSGLDAAEAEGEAMVDALAAVGCSWTFKHGPISVWVTADRKGTEQAPRWAGALVTTQAYRAQSEAAGATLAERAQALRDLLDGDATAFDAIMSA